MELIGPNLTLRPPVAEDVPALFALGSDPDATRWFSWGPYARVEQAEDYVRAAAVRTASGEQLDLLVVHRDGGPLGITGLAEHVVRDRRAVVGSWLHPRAWGTGVNAEAKLLVLHLAFDVLGLTRVAATTDVRNGRSQRALEKLGFVREGVLRGYNRHGDEVKDVVMYALLAAERPPTPFEPELRGDLPSAWVP